MPAVVCAAMTAINVALYLDDTTRWWNAGSAVFCFCMLLLCLAVQVRR